MNGNEKMNVLKSNEIKEMSIKMKKRIPILIEAQIVCLCGLLLLFFSTLQTVQRTSLKKYPYVLMLVFLKAQSLEVVLFGQHKHAL